MLNKIADVVVDVFSQYTDVSQLDPDRGFDTLDIDSLVLVELAIVLNDKLNFIVAEFEIKKANSIRALLGLYEGRKGLSLVPEGVTI
jgi:acyl carrier protein